MSHDPLQQIRELVDRDQAIPPYWAGELLRQRDALADRVKLLEKQLDKAALDKARLEVELNRERNFRADATTKFRRASKEATSVIGITYAIGARSAYDLVADHLEKGPPDVP